MVDTGAGTLQLNNRWFILDALNWLIDRQDLLGTVNKKIDRRTNL